MAELKLKNGDYVKAGGRLEKAEGREALLQRVLFKLTARLTWEGQALAVTLDIQ